MKTVAIRSIPILIAVLAVSVLAAGQTTSPQSLSPDEAKVLKVKEVLRLSHALENATKAMQQGMAKQKRLLPLPTAAQDDFERMFFEKVNGQAVIDIAVPIYVETFTSEELDEIIAFYKTPLGQKLLEKTPQLTMSVMNQCGDLGRKVGAEVGTEISRKLKAGDYGPWPPAENKTPTAAKPE
jgi:hypothetical protein